MNFDTYVVDTLEGLQDLFAYAKQFNTPVVLDVETDHVQERLAKLHGIGLCFKDDEAFYIPIRKQDRSLCWSDAELNILSAGLHGIIKQLGWIAHNGVYDSLVIEYNFGYDISQLLHTDTILLKHTVDEERPFGLKEVAVKYLGPWADKAQDAMKESIKANGGSCTKENMEMYKADMDVLAEYCCFDVILTRKLYNLFLPMLKKEGLEKFFYEEEVMPLYREVTIDMKRQGIKIDVPYFEKLQKEVTEDMRILEASIMDSIRDDVAEFEQRLLNKDYPISRKGMFPKLLADELGVVLPVGKTGTVTLSKAAVEKATKEAGDENSALFFEWLNGNDCMSSKLLRRVQFKRFQKDNDRPHVFNLKSGDHLAHLIFEVHGEMPLGTTETGKPQVDDELLESLKDRYEWIAKLVEYKKLLKLSSTYIDGVLDRHVDSIIYTSFLQFGTTSGRFSATSPNLMNLPATRGEDAGLSPLVLKYTNAIRAGFISREGKKFVDLDESALEPRCFSVMANDPNLQKIFHSGEDMYSSIAKRIFNLEDCSTFKKDSNFLGKLYPEKRRIIKTLALAVTYGAEAPRIANLLGVSNEEAQQYIDDYLNAYPGLKKYIEDSHTSAKTKGFVKTIFGRVRHLPIAKELYSKHGDKLLDFRYVNRNGLKDMRRAFKNALNNATNMQIQGLAAHIINRAALSMTRRFKENNLEAHVLLNVHDQLVIECNNEHIDKAKHIAQDCMENVVKLPVPLVAEPQIATNLRDSH